MESKIPNDNISNAKVFYWFLKKLLEQFFISLLVTYLCLLLLDKLISGFVSYYFDLSILLVLVLVCGIAASFTKDGE